MARVTLQTLADKVGVSRMTVSNAFSRPDQLSSALRKKILAAAEELGYAGPDPAARALARGSTGAVGVLLTSNNSIAYSFRDDVATRFLGAVADALESTGLALTLLSASSDGDVVTARDVAMDGVLVYSCDPAATAVGWLEKRGIPMVFVDQPATEGRPGISVDDVGGARAAAQHVLDLGHRRVGVIVTEAVAPGHGAEHPDADSATVSGRRLAGYLDALEPAGAEVLQAFVRDNTDAAAVVAARELLDRDDRPTAVLCYSDVVASGVLIAADELGLRVPEDLSVVGFDDNPLAARVRPALTTVRQDVVEKGHAAAAALTTAMKAARAGTPGPTEHVVLPTTLVVRDSTGPAPTGHQAG